MMFATPKESDRATLILANEDEGQVNANLSKSNKSKKSARVGIMPDDSEMNSEKTKKEPKSSKLEQRAKKRSSSKHHKVAAFPETQVDVAHFLHFQSNGQFQNALEALERTELSANRAQFWLEIFLWATPTDPVVSRFDSLSEENLRAITAATTAVAEIFSSNLETLKIKGKRRQQQLVRVLASTFSYLEMKGNQSWSTQSEASYLALIGAVILEAVGWSELNAFAVLCGIAEHVLPKWEHHSNQVITLIESCFPEVSAIASELGCDVGEIVVTFCKSLFVLSGVGKKTLLRCIDISLLFGACGVSALGALFFSQAVGALRKLQEEDHTKNPFQGLQAANKTMQETEFTAIYDDSHWLQDFMTELMSEQGAEITRMRSSKISQADHHHVMHVKKEPSSSTPLRLSNQELGLSDYYKEWESLRSGRMDEPEDGAYEDPALWLQVMTDSTNNCYYLHVDGHTWRWEPPSCGFVSAGGALCLPISMSSNAGFV